MAVITGLLNEYTGATGDTTFLQRVEMAVLNAAEAIATEVGTTPNHTNRSALAKAVTQPGASSGYATAFAKLIMAQGTCDPAVDSNIQNLVNSVWNTVAGGL